MTSEGNRTMLLIFPVVVLLQLVSCSISADIPQQIHLSFGENPLEVVVTWSTFEPAQSSVKFGIDGFEKTQNGTSKLFTDGGRKKRTQYIHRVTLPELNPGTKYVYRCGSDNNWSKDFWFKTPDVSNWKPKVAILGDLSNKRPKSIPFLQEEVQNQTYDAIIHVGDIAYNLHTKNGIVGDEFMKKLEPVAAYVPYMVCPGNHEKKYNFSHYKARFSMPGNSDNYFYSFNLGPAHFISLDVELYYDKGGEIPLTNQYNWLLKDLKEANSEKNRSEQPWIVVYAHRPMYNFLYSNSHTDKLPFKHGRMDVEKEDKKFALEKLIYDNNVDLYIAGHIHTYERTFPLYDFQVQNGTGNGYVNAKAPIHITTGVGGPRMRVPIIRSPYWSAFRSTDYGYSTLEFPNKTHVHFQQISVQSERRVIDDIWVEKSSTNKF